MSCTHCDVCGGAIPDGKERDGHTALCASVLSERLAAAEARIAELEAELREALESAYDETDNGRR